MGSPQVPGSSEHPSPFSSSNWETGFFLPKGDEGRACMYVRVSEKLVPTLSVPVWDCVWQ